MADSSAERVARYRERQREEAERQRLADRDEGTPWQGLVGEEREQAIRDFYGYAASETRTQAQRDTTAALILAR